LGTDARSDGSPSGREGDREVRSVRTGVIGVGHLGRLHARMYHELEEARLVGVADSDPARAEQVAKEFDCAVYRSSDALLADVEAVSVAVPTPWHAREGVGALDQGVHVLVEKPIAGTLREADDLVAAAGRAGCILQVGHVERFSGAVQAALRIADNPRFLECHRLAGFSPRGSDVAVVLDLMIHDIDIVLHLVKDEVTRVEAVGVPVLSENVDIANARLEFRNGAIANLTASRVSREKMRKIRFFQANTYVSVDCLGCTTDVYRRGGADNGDAGLRAIAHERLGVQSQEPLKEEILSFIQCIRTSVQPIVSGSVGRAALEIALHVIADIERRWGSSLRVHEPGDS